jgi:hypothetical protein
MKKVKENEAIRREPLKVCVCVCINFFPSLSLAYRLLLR